MRRLNLSLLVLGRLCLARQPAFSIHDDPFAHPQFEVIFSDSFVSEQEAQSLLEHGNGAAYSTYSADFSAESDLATHYRAANQEAESASEDAATGGEAPSFSYEIMNMPPNKYLCSIPQFDEPRPENQTAAELARAKEAKELERASERGWELLAPMGSKCLYFMPGWWSYRFCYGKNIVQYHALPQVPAGMAPVQDPETLAFMLGRAPSTPARDGGKDGESSSSVVPPNTELQIQGDQRYLVQRLAGGTICDLTGRERTIEVQYHCAPGAAADAIALIKEVTTCAYLMVINTPRLCDLPAFLPPRETTSNPITCRPILPPGDVGAGESSLPRAKTLGGGRPPKGQVLGSTSLVHPPVVGGVIVGGHNILAGAGVDDTTFTLEAPRSYMPNARGGGKVSADAQPLVEIVASGKSKEEGGEITRLSEEELNDRDMDPSFVEDMVTELRGLAGDRGWRLEVVEVPGEDRELRGIVDVEPGENLGTLSRERDGEKGGDGGDEGEEEGSQEYFIAEDL
ncbi:related to Protein OS-9 homolog [Cephalotrichum gorgonifer]|uniref:Endoplasmic reticulum lectin n=1 Tax=Cephalotrichum gorgonifer TaxID=2041049 RepID=A0AAE8N3G7_9PEZI|nr:related to Protein OS-9 homolog [Cephalotrichum gorgonifer]